MWIQSGRDRRLPAINHLNGSGREGTLVKFQAASILRTFSSSKFQLVRIQHRRVLFAHQSSSFSNLGSPILSMYLRCRTPFHLDPKENPFYFVRSWPKIMATLQGPCLSSSQPRLCKPVPRHWIAELKFQKHSHFLSVPNLDRIMFNDPRPKARGRNWS